MAIEITPTKPDSNHTSDGGLTRKLLPIRLAVDFDVDNVRTQKIVVTFREWWEETDGTKRDIKNKTYTLKDSAAVLGDDGETILQEASTDFTEWYSRLNEDTIIPSIQSKLSKL